jgi:hypothetical protein
MSEDLYLEHYGVKGMKWGVRRDRRQLKAASKGRKAGERASSRSMPSASSLSDDQLRSAVNRMQMEQQYTKLAFGEPRTSAGAQFAKGIMLNVARTTITNVAQNAASKGIAKALAANQRRKSK